MSAIIPFTFETHTVRSLLRDGDPWFVATDVANILGYSHVPHMLRMLDDDEADVHLTDSRSVNGVEQSRNISIINESGLYSVVLKSERPEAKRFKRWVTGEVLPAIRKTGSYGKAPPEAHPLDDGLPLPKRINAASYIAGLMARGDDKAYDSTLEWAFKRLGPKKKPEKPMAYQPEPARAPAPPVPEKERPKDIITAFLKGFVRPEFGKRVSAAELFFIFEIFARANGETGWTIKRFGQALREAGVAAMKSNVMYWTDVQLSNEGKAYLGKDHGKKH